MRDAPKAVTLRHWSEHQRAAVGHELDDQIVPGEAVECCTAQQRKELLAA
jgi:hypothetical protein